jgi:hypothetical protein
MIQADRVHSTPPTNTSALTPQSSRRGFLVQAAGVAAAAIGASLPLPEPLAVTAQSCDAELIELGAKFEPLLDQYYLAHRRWSDGLAQASSEHNAEFGPAAAWNYNYPPEIEDAFLRRCDRLGVREADDAMDAIHQRMVPLAEAIGAAPVHSIAGLRVRALVTLWEIAPVQAGKTDYSFDDALVAEQLFTAVAEVCGLKQKIAATGYELSDIGLAYDDADDDEGEDA